MKQNLKERVNGKSGITLIALVITIIVLLILAGVTIATLTGDNGILTKAQNAKTQNDKATAKEKVDLAIAASLDETGKINLGQLKTNLNNVDGINPIKEDLTDSSFPLEVTVDGIKATIKKDSNGKYSTSVGDDNNSTGGGLNKLDVTRAIVDNNLATVETGGTLDISSCITNKESIEEFTITNVTGNATKESDKTIKGTGTEDATATVTITGEKTGKIKDITITVKKAEVLGIGSYVNYSVDYDNVATSNDGTTYIPKDEFAGKWRILDLGANNSDGTYGTEENPVRIVSAGVPLSYYHYNNSSTSVTNLTTVFFSTPINTETKTNYNYYKCGFKNGGTTLTNINDVKSLFNNNLTAKNGETPKVQAMTKEDLDKVYDSTGATTTAYNTYVTDAKFDNMLAIPSKDQLGKYARYWLASAYNSGNLWDVDFYGRVFINEYHVTYGVRPVVSLVSNISITKGTNGAWNLSSNNN